MGQHRLAGSSARPSLALWAAVVPALVATAVGASAYLVAAQPRDASPEARGVAFLSGEVPRWPAENNCYSCHNNGDAARALYTAIRLDYTVEPEALRETTAWLQNPAAWDDNALVLKFSDTKLARIQFAGALVDAMLAGEISDPVPLAEAAELIRGRPVRRRVLAARHERQHRLARYLRDCAGHLGGLTRAHTSGRARIWPRSSRVATRGCVTSRRRQSSTPQR